MKYSWEHLLESRLKGGIIMWRKTYTYRDRQTHAEKEKRERRRRERTGFML